MILFKQLIIKYLLFGFLLSQVGQWDTDHGCKKTDFTFRKFFLLSESLILEKNFSKVKRTFEKFKHYAIVKTFSFFISKITKNVVAIKEIIRYETIAIVPQAY